MRHREIDGGATTVAAQGDGGLAQSAVITGGTANVTVSEIANVADRANLAN